MSFSGSYKWGRKKTLSPHYLQQVALTTVARNPSQCTAVMHYAQSLAVPAAQPPHPLSATKPHHSSPTCNINPPRECGMESLRSQHPISSFYHKTTLNAGEYSKPLVPLTKTAYQQRRSPWLPQKGREKENSSRRSPKEEEALIFSWPCAQYEKLTEKSDACTRPPRGRGSSRAQDLLKFAFCGTVRARKRARLTSESRKRINSRKLTIHNEDWRRIIQRGVARQY